ncbi:hypothetical protein [Okeania sp. KiyG1]|uniref:hypothetical protein n=1 Tax=Okeania sp. KiyG1 TaxID=2720165 RepID=UPI001923D32D|nr:hypothetical protein [Okeania sp. KiyG1]
MSCYLNFPDFRHFVQVKFSVNARKKKEEGRRQKEEGRRKEEEGRRKKEKLINQYP